MLEILVTSRNVQSAQCSKTIEVCFQDLSNLNIINPLQYESYFSVSKFDYYLKYTARTVVDLAKVLIKIVLSSSISYNIYHYSNGGIVSWYDFAVEIFKQFGKSIEVKPIKTKDYPTAAKRPEFSVLHTTKIENNFDCTIKDWQVSLDKITQTNLCNKKQR